MTRYKWFVLICLLAPGWFSCKRNTTDHIPAKKMEKVLLDISLAETFSTNGRETNHFGGVKNVDSLATYYREIFAHYNITQQQFTESMNWYKNHPDDLDTIYGNIANRNDKMLSDQNAKKKL